jgi:DNA-3-methyladenine glycosylase II
MRITCDEPYDFTLSWSVFCAFSGRHASPDGALAMWWHDRPTAVFIHQGSLHPPVLDVVTEPFPAQSERFRARLREILHADLDLKPFYATAREHPVPRGVVSDLNGLKPIRPTEIFQMMVIAVSEQQVSMAAARSIRERILRTFGASIRGLTAFPRPEDLASRDVGELRAWGLSASKAEYMLLHAKAMADGEIDATAWEDMTDEELVRSLCELPGIGRWTAEYIALRGLGKMDVVPASDLGVRKAVGAYLAGGNVPSEAEVRDMLRPFSPWRGLAAFYLLAHRRRSQMGLDQAQ